MEMANERKRDGGIVAPEWWRAEATNKRKDQGIRNEDLAELVAKRLHLEAIDPSRISRCLSGITSTIPLLEAISAVLGMEPPVFLAESPSEAREIASIQRTARERARMLAEADRKIADVQAQLAKARENASTNVQVLQIQEAAALRQAGAWLVRVHRPGAGALAADTAGHESEGHTQLQVDDDLDNSGTLADLNTEVAALLQRLRERAALAKDTQA